MNCEQQRERMALRLYDELSTAEANELREHLEACADCRDFAAELERGLGAVPRGAPATELPPDWRERLDDATGAPQPKRVGPRWPTFVAGLAAGMLVTFLLPALRADSGEVPSHEPPPTLSTNAGTDIAFAPRDTPPPKATGGGSLSRIKELVVK